LKIRLKNDNESKFRPKYFQSENCIVDLKQFDDIALMKLISHGNNAAFTELVHRYQNSLVNFFYGMGAYTGECEDLAQETFIRLYHYRTRYEPRAKFSTFLYRVARNTFIDMVRKKKSLPDYNSELLEHGGFQSLNQDANRELREEIENALEKLSEKLRSVIVLSFLQGFKYHEIADILEIPVGTVKSRIHLAFQQLKEILKPEKANEHKSE